MSVVCLHQTGSLVRLSLRGNDFQVAETINASVLSSEGGVFLLEM